ncbi:hypothetical protein SH203_00680 [Brevundimonas sp. SH203]|uniref:DUF7065 domain-containing protein n=1 Tax=Brevundimonas sp. SH203 TaxID=345167 RepID=UPI0009D2AAC5|nr:hypothetical protein [Brevundimonas sp. SH203]GAW40283.1 hypothetical protein SH203_00680 [Brevundimonas sp. SH203]
MFTDEDVRYHLPETVPYNWAETSFFYFYVPKANIIGLFYIVARPGVGTMINEIEIWSEMSDDLLRASYIDTQQNLPMPERFEKFSLPNGTSYEAKGIRSYRIDHVGSYDTELHLDVVGLMPPYDIHDPEMDPLALPHEDSAVASGVGASFSAHFDMTTRVTGTIKVRGRSYDVDCIATMDHSFGVRSERGGHPMAWINANFSETHAFHAIWKFFPDRPIDQQYELVHGYALIDGKVRGAKGGRMIARHLGRVAVSYEMTIIDCDDVEHRMYGTATASHTLQPYGYVTVPVTLTRWHKGDQIGWGHSQEVYLLHKQSGLHLDEKGSE